MVPGWRNLLQSYVRRRSKGEPLQYILGNQPFGEKLEILCEKGVLIPRWETEVWTEKIGGLGWDFLGEDKGNGIEDMDGDTGDSRRRPTVRVLDLCTGTGCVALGVYEILSRRVRGMGKDKHEGRGLYEVKVTGFDISTTALDLARRSLRHNISLGHLPKEAAEDIEFTRADILAASSSSTSPSRADQPKAPYILDVLQAQDSRSKQDDFDILTANPPYISPAHFSLGSSGRTARSVRKYEPSLALVPGQSINPPRVWPDDVKITPGDEFYYHILPLTFALNVGLTVLEVGDTEQAHRAVELARVMASMADARRGDTETLLELWLDDGRTEVWGAKDVTPTAGKDTAILMATKRAGEAKADRPESDQVEEASARAIVVWRREWAKWRKKYSTERW